MLTARSLLSNARTIGRSTFLNSRGLFSKSSAHLNKIDVETKDIRVNVMEGNVAKAIESAGKAVTVDKAPLVGITAKHQVASDSPTKVTFSRSKRVKRLLKAAVINIDKGNSVKAAKSLVLAGYTTVIDFIAEFDRLRGVKSTIAGSKEWTYTELGDLCSFLFQNTSPSVGNIIRRGKSSLFRLRLSGWYEGEMEIEDVQIQMKFVLDFIKIFENEGEVDTNLAQCFKMK